MHALIQSLNLTSAAKAALIRASIAGLKPCAAQKQVQRLQCKYNDSNASATTPMQSAMTPMQVQRLQCKCNDSNASATTPMQSATTQNQATTSPRTALWLP